MSHVLIIARPILLAGLLLGALPLLGACEEGGGFGASDALADTPQDTPASGPDWSCLGRVEAERPAASTLEVPVVALDPVSRQRAGGLVVRVCRGFDPSCLDEASTQVMGADGSATLSLDAETAGFVGYLEVTGGGVVPTIVSLNRPITRERAEPLELPVFTEAAYASFLATAGATADPTRGHLLLTSWDCADLPAAGTRFSLPTQAGAATGYYLAGGTADTDAFSTAARGIGGFANVTPGSVNVAATREITGQRIGDASVFARAGWLTAVTVRPSP